MKRLLLFLVLGLLYSCSSYSSVSDKAMKTIMKNCRTLQKNYSELDYYDEKFLEIFYEDNIFSKVLLNEVEYNQERKLQGQELAAWLDDNFQINKPLTYYKLLDRQEDTIYTYYFETDSYERYYGDIDNFQSSKDLYRDLSESMSEIIDKYKEGEHFYGYRRLPAKKVVKYRFKVNLHGEYKIGELRIMKFGFNDYEVISYKHYPYIE